MTRKLVSDEQLGQLARRQEDLFRRVREGTLPVDSVLLALQRIGEGGLVGTPVEQQVELVRRRNEERGWGLGHDLRTLGKPPKRPDLPYALVTLAVCLPDQEGSLGANRTFQEMWEWIESQYPDASRIDSGDNALQFDLVRPMDGIAYAPGIRWVALDVCSFRKVPVRSLNHLELAPHAAILTALVLHPEWVQRMDGNMFPYPFIHGYLYGEREQRDPCVRVPRISVLKRPGYNIEMLLHTESGLNPSATQCFPSIMRTPV